MLRLDLKPGDSVRIGDGANSVVVTLEEKSGKAARIAFQADRSVPIVKIQKRTAADLMKGGLAQAAST